VKKNLVEELYANAKLVKGFRIDVDDSRSHCICLDLQPELGTDMGPSALELCVMSNAGCYATIFVLTAKKMRVALKDLEVKLKAVKSDETGTLTEVNLDIMVKADIPYDRIQRIHKLTLANCPVGKLFEKAGVKVDYKINVEK